MKLLFSLLIGLTCLLVLSVAAIRPASAQTVRTPITPENISQITQMERVGNGVPRQMTFSPDGSRLAVATTLGVWRIDPTSVASMTLFEGQGGAESVAFSSDGSMIAAGGDDNSVMIWDSASGKAVERLENHIYPVTAVAWAGKYIASGDESGVVRVWDTATWREYRVLADASGHITALRFVQSDSQIKAITDDGWYVWNVASSLLISQNKSNAVQDSLNVSLGEWSATYSVDKGQITFSDFGVRGATLDGFYGELGGIFFTSDGRVGANPFKSPYLWSVSSGQVDDSTPPPVTSPDGSRVATFGNDGVIRLTDATTGREIAALHGHIRAVTSLAFNPDGKLLVSSSNDGTIQLWDATVTEDSGSLITLRGHNGGITSVAFNADGTLLASSGYDGTVRLWAIKG